VFAVSQCHDHVATLPHAAAVKALTEYFTTLRQKQFALYFLTLTYKQAADIPLTLPSVSKTFDRAYIELLRRYIHPSNFARPKYRPLQPIVFAFPDYSKTKFKHATWTSSGIVGLHHHAIAAACPEVAMRLDPACFANSLTSLSSFILTSDLRRIGATHNDIKAVVDYATSYAFKKLPKANEDYRLLVYPHVERWKQAHTPVSKWFRNLQETPSANCLIPHAI
jgi:hypothetical protein